MVSFRQPPRPVMATLVVGGERLGLRIEGREAWTLSPRDDRRAVAAMREGGALTIEARAPDGRRFRDFYPLEGAASAIDAVRVRCLNR